MSTFERFQHKCHDNNIHLSHFLHFLFVLFFLVSILLMQGLLAECYYHLSLIQASTFLISTRADL